MSNVSKTKVVALAALIALGGTGLACSSSGVGEKSGPPANANAAPPANKPAATAPAPAATTAVAGLDAETLPIYNAHCAICHGTDAKGHANAPNLFEVKDKHTADEWAAYLKNPKIWEKDNKMPPVQNASDADLKKIGEWLAATTGKSGGAAGDEKKDAKSEGMKKS